VITDTQTQGVGSRGNRWESLDGNLFVSFCLSLDALPTDLKVESASIYFSYMLKEPQKFGSSGQMTFMSMI